LAVGFFLAVGRHADVHEDDVGPKSPHRVDSIGPVSRFSHDIDVVLAVQDHDEAGANQLLIVDDQDSNAHRCV
jgi:hypothetical protein